MISSMMNQEGSIIPAVVLKADGTVEEVQYDTTPKANKIQDFLGGAPTIVGQYSLLNGVVVLKQREPSSDLPENKHQPLRFPLHNEPKVLGPLFLVRMNENATPVAFTKKEYEEFVAKRDEDAELIKKHAEQKVEMDTVEERELPKDMIAEQLMSAMSNLSPEEREKILAQARKEFEADHGEEGDEEFKIEDKLRNVPMASDEEDGDYNQDDMFREMARGMLIKHTGGAEPTKEQLDLVMNKIKERFGNNQPEASKMDGVEMTADKVAS